MNSGNITPNIEASIDKTFSFATVLDIPNVQLDNCHIRLWRHFDNTKSRDYHNIVEDVIALNNQFNYIY